MQKLLKLIGMYHSKAFAYVSKRAATSIWFALLLSFMGLYEIFEHFVIPAALVAWAWFKFF